MKNNLKIVIVAAVGATTMASISPALAQSSRYLSFDRHHYRAFVITHRGQIYDYDPPQNSYPASDTAQALDE